jgi:hypothetical protein
MGKIYQNGKNIPKWGKIYQNGKKCIPKMAIKCTKMGKIYQMWPWNIPNLSKIDRMSIKLTNNFHCKTLQNLPKLVWKYNIWQPCSESIESILRSHESILLVMNRFYAVLVIRVWTRMTRLPCNSWACRTLYMGLYLGPLWPDTFLKINPISQSWDHFWSCYF